MSALTVASVVLWIRKIGETLTRQQGGCAGAPGPSSNPLPDHDQQQKRITAGNGTAIIRTSSGTSQLWARYCFLETDQGNEPHAERYMMLM